MIGRVGEDFVGGGSVGSFVVGHEDGVSVPFHEKGGRCEWLPVPVARERMDVVGMEKDGSVEIVGSEVMTEFFLPRAAEGRFEFGRLA